PQARSSYPSRRALRHPSSRGFASLPGPSSMRRQPTASAPIRSTSRLGMRVGREPSERRGAALLVALSLIVLAGALLAATSASARTAARSSHARVSAALADTRPRTELARLLAACDSGAPQLA